MTESYEPPRANKTDAGNGSNGICRVINASRSPSPDPKRSAMKAGVDDYVRQMRANDNRHMISRFKWVVVAFIALLIATYCTYNSWGKLIRASAVVCSSIGAKSLSESLSVKAHRLEMERSAAKLYGCEVAWIKLPRSRTSSFSAAMLRHVPLGVSISFVTAPHHMIEACVPKESKEAILEEIERRYAKEIQDDPSSGG